MRIYHTATVHNFLAVTHTCSKCGHKNYAIQPVKESRTAQTNAFFGDSPEEVQQSARLAMFDKIEKIAHEADEHIYRTARFNIKCSNCKHKEPWSRLDDGPIKKILSCFHGIVLIAVLFMLLEEQYHKALTAIAAAAVITAVVYGFTFINRAMMEKRIKNLPPESLPDFTVLKNNGKR